MSLNTEMELFCGISYQYPPEGVSKLHRNDEMDISQLCASASDLNSKVDI